MSLAAHAEGDVEDGPLPALQVVGRVVDVADGQIPVAVHVVDEVVGELAGLNLVGMYLPDLGLAGEERRVAAGQLVPHLDGEAEGAGVGRSLLLGDSVAAAALGLPPAVGRRLLSAAIELDGRAPGHGVFDVELAAARDGAVDAVGDERRPTKGVVAPLVGAEGEGPQLHGVFGDGRLALRGGGGRKT